MTHDESSLVRHHLCVITDESSLMSHKLWQLMSHRTNLFCCDTFITDSKLLFTVPFPFVQPQIQVSHWPPALDSHWLTNEIRWRSWCSVTIIRFENIFRKINVEISNNQESADISSIDSRTKPTFVYCLGIFKIIGSAVFADNHFSIVKFGTCPNLFIYFWVNLNFRWNRESEIFSPLNQSQSISRILILDNFIMTSSLHHRRWVMMTHHGSLRNR